MREGHPHPTLLRAILEESLSGERALLLHVLGCPRCRSRARAALRPRPAGEARAEGPYAPLFLRLLATAAAKEREVEAEREAAHGLLLRLFKTPLSGRPAFLAEEPGARRPAFVHTLLAEAKKKEEPQLARLALTAVGLLSDEAPRPLREALELETRTVLGDLLARHGRLLAARRTLSPAARLVSRVADPVSRGRYLMALGCLRRKAGLSVEAAGLLAEAAHLFAASGSAAGESAALAALGSLALRELADPGRASALFAQLLMTARGAASRTKALRGLVQGLAMDGSAPDSWSAFLSERPTRVPEGSRAGLLLLSLEGRLLAALDRLAPAADCLSRAFEGFSALGPSPAALVAGLALLRVLGVSEPGGPLPPAALDRFLAILAGVDDERLRASASSLLAHLEEVPLHDLPCLELFIAPEEAFHDA